MNLPARYLILAATLSLLMGCVHYLPNIPRKFDLPSGHHVQVLDWGSRYFTSGESADWLSYETNVSMTDNASLNAIQSEMWQKFKSTVDQSGFAAAIFVIQSSSPVPGGTVVPVYRFVYRRINGDWTLTDPLPENK